MVTPRRCDVLIALVIALTSACSGASDGNHADAGSERADITDTQSGTDAHDAADVYDAADARGDVGTGDEPAETLVPVTCAGPAVDSNCDPSAHIDCFGDVSCSGGAVYVAMFAPIPCCNEASCTHAFITDLQICACDMPSYRCSSGTCPTIVSRYSGCARNVGGPSEIPRSLLRSLCDEPAPTVGQACISDDDCRPAPAGGTPLRCDTATHMCVATTRPPVPACGGPTPRAVPCLEDEDCPAGATCSCSAGSFGGACVRSDADGGTTPVMCTPATPDAGFAD